MGPDRFSIFNVKTVKYEDVSYLFFVSHEIVKSAKSINALKIYKLRLTSTELFRTFLKNIKFKAVCRIQIWS